MYARDGSRPAGSRARERVGRGVIYQELPLDHLSPRGLVGCVLLSIHVTRDGFICVGEGLTQILSDSLVGIICVPDVVGCLRLVCFQAIASEA